MKTESTLKFVIRLAGTLLLIAAVVAGVLAAVNGVTAPIIAQMKAEKTQKAIEAVLPGGGQEIAFTDDTGIVSKVYASEKGYAVEVVPAGFNGGITMMVGVDKQGNVTGISIISQTETAGLGAVAAEKGSKGQSFRDQFIGLNGTLAVDKDGGEVDSISGATISSRAVTTGVNAALKCVANLVKEG